MKIWETAGWVAGLHPFSESDWVATLYTEARGKIQAIAKGARRSRRRFGGRLDLLNRCLFRLVEKETTSLLRLEEADLIASYQGMKGDLDRLLGGMQMLETACLLAPEGEAQQAVSAILEEGFSRIEDGTLSVDYIPGVLMKIVSLEGYHPEFGHCLDCGRVPRREDRPWGLIATRGGVRCPSCGIDGENVDPADLLFFATCGPGWGEGAGLSLEDLSGLPPPTPGAIDVVRKYVRALAGKEIRSASLRLTG